jgi:hypothetical protein
MKKLILILFPLIIGVSLSAQDQKNKISEYPLINTEKIIEYTWDLEKADWIYKNIIKYNYTYDNGLIQKLTVIDYYTSMPISQTIYFYSTENILKESLYQNWVSGSWRNTRRDLWFHNEEGLTIEAIIQFMQNDLWINSIRYTDYQYDNRQLQQYTYQNWSNEQWINSFFDSWYYDDRGNLVLREQIRMNGIPINKFIYVVDENNLRQNFTLYNWINGLWVENYRILYEYNQCGRINSIILQTFKNGIWVNSTKQEYFYIFDSDILQQGQRVPLCHNGHTIYVYANAVNAHLKHGDCLGECLTEKKENSKINSDLESNLISLPFTVYPNPIHEQFTIKFEKEKDLNINRIELTDFYGKTLRTINVNGQEEITIYREGLKSGNYLIKMIGNEIFQIVVIFE